MNHLNEKYTAERYIEKYIVILKETLSCRQVSTKTFNFKKIFWEETPFVIFPTI